jgi:hypothetical protein
LELVVNASGALLFVRIDDIVAAQGLADFSRLMEGLTVVSPGDVAPERPDDWRVELAATQARLADAVQEIVRLREGKPLRLGLMLSAWDKEASRSPDTWARENLGLLCQLLDGQSSVEWTVFGASAQGGDFDDEQDLERLNDTPLSTRASIARLDGGEVSVSTPIEWVLDITS